MKHQWPEELVDVGKMPRDPDFGDFYWVTARATHCARCGRSRKEARGVPRVSRDAADRMGRALKWVTR